MTRKVGKILSSTRNENEIPLMRNFVLERSKDISGTSGTGIVAVGIVFPSGQCVMEWNSLVKSLNYYHSIADLESVHSHEGATKIRFLDKD